MYKAKSKVPESPKAVNFFRHFIGNFIQLYGIAHKGLTQEETILKRVVPMNCEWLLRPKVAASEFADTVEQNLKYLSSCKLPFVKSDKFAQWQEKFAPLMEALAKLNTTNDQGQANPVDVKTMLKTKLSDDETMDQFQNLVEAGSSMYLMGIHFSVAKTIFTNPEWYAEKSVGDSKPLRAFKANPSIKGLKAFLTETCTASTSTTSSASSTPKRNLAALLESDESDGGSIEEEMLVHKNKKSKKIAGKICNKDHQQVTHTVNEKMKKQKKNKKAKK